MPLAPPGLRPGGFFCPFLMSRVSFLVDGFNLYHSLRDASRDTGGAGKGTKWLDIKALCESHLGAISARSAFPGRAETALVRYYTAIAHHRHSRDNHAVGRHKRLIKCMKASGVDVVTSSFKLRKDHCPKCHRDFDRYEEKQTDVALAVDLIQLALRDESDIFVVVSGDTDMIPAVKAVNAFAPSKEVWALFPYARKQSEIEQVVVGSTKISADAYAKHQFPEEVQVGGQMVRKPAEW